MAGRGQNSRTPPLSSPNGTRGGRSLLEQALRIDLEQRNGGCCAPGATTGSAVPGSNAPQVAGKPTLTAREREEAAQDDIPEQMQTLAVAQSKQQMDTDGQLTFLYEQAYAMPDILDAIEEDITVERIRNDAQDISLAALATRSTAIETTNTAQDAAIAVEKARNDQQNIAINSLNARATAIETSDSQQNTRLTAVETKNTQQDGRLSAVETKNTQQDTAIAAEKTRNDTQDTQIAALAVINLAEDNRLAALEARETVTEAKNAQQDTRLDALEAGQKIYYVYPPTRAAFTYQIPSDADGVIVSRYTQADLSLVLLGGLVTIGVTVFPQAVTVTLPRTTQRKRKPLWVKVDADGLASTVVTVQRYTDGTNADSVDRGTSVTMNTQKQVRTFINDYAVNALKGDWFVIGN